MLAASTAACAVPAFYLLRDLHPTFESVLHAMLMVRIIISHMKLHICLLVSLDGV